MSIRTVMSVLLTAVSLLACSANADSEPGTPGAEDTTGAPLPDDQTGSAGDIGDPQDTGPNGDAILTPADETVPPPANETFAATSQAKTTANLNLRKSASTSAAVLLVIPSGATVTVLNATQTNGFLNVQYNGTAGWGYASYLAPITSGGSGTPTAGDPNGPANVPNAIARAAASVGFSYYWGGGAWLASGPTSSTKGSCSGSCPSCSHSGKYGADCSGMVAKAWEFGPKDLATNSHLYSTGDFVSSRAGMWSIVSRSSIKKGDALAYNTGGAGHIVLWESGDGWGASTVYECRGCAYGCVHDTRTFSTTYKGVRRAGF
jgi:hypothetical protein